MSIEIERKFLLSVTPDWRHPLLRDADVIDFEQIYLEVSATDQKRIRRGSRDGLTAYHYAHLVRLAPATREVTEKEIDREQYERLRSLADPARQPVKKIRRCFTWRNQFFELDEIRAPATRACCVVEMQVDDRQQEVTLPDFLHLDREVTGEDAYSNATIALG